MGLKLDADGFVHDIFYGISNRLDHVRPEDVRMIYDRVMVRALAPEEMIGSIEIPQYLRNDLPGLKIGIVLAVGPGDRWSEHGLDVHGDPIRRFLPDGKRYPMPVKVGDVVVFDRRAEATFQLDGIEVGLVHAEQSIFAILGGEDDE